MAEYTEYFADITDRPQLVQASAIFNQLHIGVNLKQLTDAMQLCLDVISDPDCDAKERLKIVNALHDIISQVHYLLAGLADTKPQNLLGKQTKALLIIASIAEKDKSFVEIEQEIEQSYQPGYTVLHSFVAAAMALADLYIQQDMAAYIEHKADKVLVDEARDELFTLTRAAIENADARTESTTMQGLIRLAAFLFPEQKRGLLASMYNSLAFKMLTQDTYNQTDTAPFTLLVDETLSPLVGQYKVQDNLIYFDLAQDWDLILNMILSSSTQIGHLSRQVLFMLAEALADFEGTATDDNEIKSVITDILLAHYATILQNIAQGMFPKEKQTVIHKILDRLLTLPTGEIDEEEYEILQDIVVSIAFDFMMENHAPETMSKLANVYQRLQQIAAIPESEQEALSNVLNDLREEYSQENGGEYVDPDAEA